MTNKQVLCKPFSSSSNFSSFLTSFSIKIKKKKVKHPKESEKYTKGNHRSPFHVFSPFCSSYFFHFSGNRCEIAQIDYFNQQMAFEAPSSWSKYPTNEDSGTGEEDIENKLFCKKMCNFFFVFHSSFRQ